MKRTALNASLMVTTGLSMMMAMAGCEHDRHHDRRDRNRMPDRERLDNDRHDDYLGNDRQDEGRGGR